MAKQRGQATTKIKQEVELNTRKHKTQNYSHVQKLILYFTVFNVPLFNQTQNMGSTLSRLFLLP